MRASVTRLWDVQAHQAPEVLRVPLQQLCLTMRANLPSSVSVPRALARLLTPPPDPAVAAALHSLTSLGALEGGGALTMLGRHLARMPMDPQLGKALIYGALLRCLPFQETFSISSVTLCSPSLRLYFNSSPRQACIPTIFSPGTP